MVGNAVGMLQGYGTFSRNWYLQIGKSELAIMPANIDFLVSFLLKTYPCPLNFEIKRGLFWGFRDTDICHFILTLDDKNY